MVPLRSPAEIVLRFIFYFIIQQDNLFNVQQGQKAVFHLLQL